MASDAIGMGLNLNIRRVVFTTLEKFHGDSNGVELMAATQVSSCNESEQCYICEQFCVTHCSHCR